MLSTAATTHAVRGSQVRQLSLCCGRRGNWQSSHIRDWEATVRMSVISCSNSSSSDSVDSVWSVRLKCSIKVQFIDLTSVIRYNNSTYLSLYFSLSLSLALRPGERPGVPLIDGCMPHRPHSAQYICREQRNRDQTCGQLRRRWRCRWGRGRIRGWGMGRGRGRGLARGAKQIPE